MADPEPPDPKNPDRQLSPPVEVMWTAVAVTAPVESLEPAAVTQSPTARAEEGALWLSL